MAEAPETRSGARYAGVPITVPVRVTGTDPATCAIPKSVIFTWPSAVSSRLAGLMSRCTSAAACAVCKARRDLGDHVHGLGGAERPIRQDRSQ